jgi:ribosomal protein L9
MATVAQSVPIASKSFRNYLGAREKRVEIDKEHIDKLNDKAFKKIKNEKLAEKGAKDRKMEMMHKQGKIHEKVAKNKNNFNLNNVEVERESHTAFKSHIRNTEERIKKKSHDLHEMVK